MENMIQVISRTCDETDNVQENKKKVNCPECDETGKYVQNVTVRHIIKK